MRTFTYQRQAGQHFNPWTFDDLKTIADHAHYAGNIRDHAFWGENKTKRPSAPSDTSALGGGHAHSGLALYLSDEFPPQYRGDAFFHNLHGHRLVRERLERNGSGYVARHRPDFVLARDHTFIGVGVMLGPDGAMYFSDWADPQTCHHRDVEIWDRSNGRIFRVRYGNARSASIDLAGLGDLRLVAKLGDSNAFIARQAQRLLQERSLNPSFPKDEIKAALLDKRKDPKATLRAFWTAHVTGLLSEADLVGRLDDPNEYVRSWAIQFLGEKKSPLSAEALGRMERLAREEYSLVTRRYLASLLQRLPHDQRPGIAKGLIAHGRSIQDPNIPLLCWYGIEPLMDTNPGAVLSLGQATGWPRLKEFITRRGIGTAEGRENIMLTLSKARSPGDFQKHAGEMLRALATMPPVDPPENWKQARSRGEQLAKKDPAIQDALSRLGVRFGDPDFFPKWRAIARDGKRRGAQRVQAVKLLTAGNDPELGNLALELIDVPAIRPAAIAALRSHPGRESANAIVSRIDKFPLKLRNEAINFLASRPDMALVLLEAVDGKHVDTSLVSPVMLDQFERFKNEKIDRLISENWVRGSGEVDPAQLRQSIEDWKKKLTPQVLAGADVSLGRETYKMTCGICHQLFGEGIAIGPDLTGSNRADLGYVLENVLAPSAVVGKDYLLTVFTMNDGSTVGGMIREETPEFIKVAMPGGLSVDVKVAEIKDRQQLNQSLMPAGLFDALSRERVAGLVKYLASPRQVPLPGEAPPGKVPPPANGVVRIEGESLVGKSKPEGGKLTAQPMSHFGVGWSQNRHLWWTGGKPGEVLSLRVENLEPGTKKLTLFPTTARDYGTIRVEIDGQFSEADLYTEKVLPGEAIQFDKVEIEAGKPLQIDIHITGKNENAVPAYMVGIDRIEIGERK